MRFKVFISCILIFVLQINGLHEGDKCIAREMEGVCTNINNCKSLVDDIKNNRGAPKLCSFSRTDPIVCCLDSPKPVTYQPPVATTSTRRPNLSTEYVPSIYDYIMYNNDPSSQDRCEAIPVDMTAKKTGQKAWNKCIEYQNNLVYPCEKGLLNGKLKRSNKCRHNALELIARDVSAKFGEFPHMVLLGYEKNNSMAWLCGGTLLSERFILTAGHCTSSREFGKVKYARTAVLRRTDPLDPSRFYKIRNVFEHPEYLPPSKYNDIALLETDRDMQLDELALPACLDVGAPAEELRLVEAVGWGATANRGAVADQLQRVFLEKFSTDECAELIPSKRNLRNGFDEKTQICYGDKKMSRDSCQGDSGGPLQLKHRQIHCMYTVVGVTSYSRACESVGEVGIYSRVQPYVPWIESIVWP